MAEYNAALVRKSRLVLEAIRRYEDKHPELKKIPNRQIGGCVNKHKLTNPKATIYD